MRFLPTFLVLSLATACSDPATIEPAGEPETESSASSDTSNDPEPIEPGNDSAGFVPEYDLGPDPNACDPVQPECDAGQKCTLVRDAESSDFVGRCVPIADETVTIGERCVPLDEPGQDNCEAGSVCWDIMNGEGTCLSFCSPDAGICEEGFVCNWGKSLAAGLCTPLCDPLSTADCPETCACYWDNVFFFCLPRTSNIPVGEPCGFINDCAPLHMCVAAEVMPSCAGSACCAAFCDLSIGACGPDTSCVAFFEEGMAPPNYEHIGVCIDPDRDG